jgi:hypothetical protein
MLHKCNDMLYILPNGLLQKGASSRVTEARRAVRGHCIPIPPAIRAAMRHPPMRAPKGSLQICYRICQVSESCHISAMTPNSSADAPKTIRPYNAVFTQKKQRRRCFGPVAQARSFPLHLSAPDRRNAAHTNSITFQAICGPSPDLALPPPTRRLSDVQVNIMLNPHAATQ